MALGEENVVAVFEEAKQMLTDPHACFKFVTSTMHMTLPPRSLGNVKSGILEQLNAQLRLHNERLNGMLVAYNHVRIQQPFGAIMTSQPDVHFDIVAEFIVFQPTPGSVLKATVTKTERSSVGCLVHGCFNASFPLFGRDEESRHQYQAGDEVLLEVQKIYTTRDGLISIKSKVVEKRRGRKRSFRETDVDVTDTSFTSPVTYPPKKRHKKGDQGTSTPMSTPQHITFNDDLSAEEQDSASLESATKHKKKKRKRQDTMEHSEDVDELSHSSGVAGSSGKKKKKKREKDMDRDCQLLNSSQEQESSQMSMLGGSPGLSSSGLEFVTDGEARKKKKKKRTSEPTDTDVKPILSDSSCSNITIDSGVALVGTSSKKKKKHNKGTRE